MTDFMETRWSLIARAVHGQRDAVGEIYQIYWMPLVAFARYELGLDPGFSEELVQDFTSRALLEGRLLERADPGRGKFRAYLKASFRHFVYERWRSDRAAGRQPPKLHSLAELDDFDAIGQPGEPLLVVEKMLALQRLAQALKRWKNECRQRDPRRWHAFELRVLQPLVDGTEPPPYEEIYRPLGYATPESARTAIVTASRAIRRHLRAVVREELTGGTDLEALVQEQARELRQQRADAGLEACEREATRILRQELEEAVDEELLDLRQVLSVEEAVPNRVRQRRPLGPHLPDAAPDESDESSALERSSLGFFLAAHLEDGESVPAASRGISERRTILPPHPAACDLQRVLVNLLDVAPTPPPGSTPDRLQTQLQQLLSGPLPWTLPPALDPTEMSPAASSGSAACCTVRELLKQTQPSLDLLTELKEFCRTNGKQKPRLPKELANVLYFAAIGTALIRCRQRISSLADSKLLMGIDWVLAQTWIDNDIRQLLQAAGDLLRPPEPQTTSGER